ncbi:hypothetical protein [Pseudooceanicola algae]|uniref:Sulfotransferase family protein n=1 Tax=Pseudooceanicola algae TaxID=1537215 RepID=A0A418SDR4_9RHOB|nr:hypothetical protein [Pseudooceanicola algae]QPM91067.1 hypothetical protein PSAL_023100 [Pseudooceanicola algae]
MLPRLVIHPGFHKTGTSAVQHALKRDRQKLASHLRVYVKSDMPALCKAARTYGQCPEPLEMSLFIYEVACLFETIDPADPRLVLLSGEDLSGAMPGREGRQGYPVAAPLMTALLDTVAEVWGDRPETTIHYSTRAPDAWTQSCHAQHLRASRMRMDLQDYTDWQRPHADLSAQVAAIIGALPGDMTVVQTPLEACQGQEHGPLAPLLDLAEIPLALRQRMAPVPHRNSALPAEVRSSLLDLNRSDAAPEALRREKAALVARAEAQMLSQVPHTRPEETR